MSKRSAEFRLQFVPPSIPTLVEKPPQGDGWIHEVKFDGYRSQIILAQGRARVFTRRGYDWTEKYGPLGKAASGLPVDNAIIDGEVIVTNDGGISDFTALRRSIVSAPERLVFRRLRPSRLKWP